MPRKTKKQKRQADKRRTSLKSIPPSIADTGKVEPVVVAKTKVKKKTVVAEYTETSYDKKLRKFTLTDTRKTFIITFVLFLIQAGVFFASTKGWLINPFS